MHQFERIRETLVNVGLSKEKERERKDDTGKEEEGKWHSTYDRGNILISVAIYVYEASFVDVRLHAKTFSVVVGSFVRPPPCIDDCQ